MAHENILTRFGIGEWYGESFAKMPPERRREFAEMQAQSTNQKPTLDCPFQSTGSQKVTCTKKGGICSIRLYQHDPQATKIATVTGTRGALCTTCPKRFQEDSLVYQWVGEVVLGSSQPLVIGEIGFLEGLPRENTRKRKRMSRDDVGRIDNVLVKPGMDRLEWCALEIQAVYFSGDSMDKEFKAMAESNTSLTLPFPTGKRRPDYRSSGPKRLMPQLQIKVPSLRRWGKKTAVVVDENFFAAMGTMDDLGDMSNCDIAWFVVRYEETGDRLKLSRGFVRFTTLERAVEGLTAGSPVSLETFEERIREKLAKEHPSFSSSPDSGR